MAAIIGGGVALIAPITTYIATRLYDQRSLQKLDGSRRALLGKWRGELIQEYEGKPVAVVIDLEFTAANKKIEGVAEVDDFRAGRPRDKLKLEGGFRVDRYIKLDYENRDPAVFQFGTFVAKLQPDGKTLKGHFVGYGYVTDRILHGEATLLKQA